MTHSTHDSASAHRLVLIEWEDSHVDGVWHVLTGEIEDRALVCRSVGWLLLDGAHAKVVAPHINEAEDGVPLQACGMMTIPARAVLRVVELAQHDTGVPDRTTASSCRATA